MHASPSPSQSAMASSEGLLLLIGLGNPGAEYAHTRHNAGAWLIEALLAKENLQLVTHRKCLGKVAQLSLDDKTLRLFIPTTFMNLSGQAVSSVLGYFNIPVENMLIVHDELDLAPGCIRYKASGGHGGHNGLRDIIQQLGHGNFARLRIGIGHPGHKDRVSGYVLNRPSKDEAKLITEAIEQSLGLLPLLVAGKSAQFMNQLHSFNP